MTKQEPEHRAGRSGVEGAPANAVPNAAPFDAEHPPPLDFAAWAGMAARLLQRDAVERLEILAECEIDPGLWERCEIYWAELLAREIGAGEMGRATDYAERCAKELAARRRTGAARPPAHGEATPGRAGALTADGSRAHASSSATPGEPSVDETAWLLAPVVVPALPFSSAGAPRAPGPIVRPTDSRLDLAGETQAIGDAAPAGAPLPFVPTLSVEDYAALCAKIATNPAEAATISSAYGIASAQQLQATHIAWLRRFDREPELRAIFEKLHRQDRNQLHGAAGAPSPGAAGAGPRHMG